MASLTLFCFSLYAVFTALACIYCAYDELKQSRVKWHELSLREKGASLFKGLCLVVFFALTWPIILVFALVQEFLPERFLRVFYRGKMFKTEPEDHQFVVLPEHLGGVLDVGAIEQASLVHDPLDSAPAVPFGHLHIRWLELRGQIKQGCHLREFSCSYRQAFDQPWGMPFSFAGHQYAGLAVVNAEGQIVSHWVTSVLPLPDNHFRSSQQVAL